MPLKCLPPQTFMTPSAKYEQLENAIVANPTRSLSHTFLSKESISGWDLAKKKLRFCKIFIQDFSEILCNLSLSQAELQPLIDTKRICGHFILLFCLIYL